MADPQNDGNSDDVATLHIPISRTLATAFGVAVASIGFGGGISVSPFINQVEIQQCFDNANRAVNAANRAGELASNALSVATQHGEEFNEVRKRIDTLRDSMYSEQDAKDERRQHNREHAIIDRRLDAVEP